MGDTTVEYFKEYIVEGKRLGRHIEHDIRSLAYLIEDDVIAGVRIAERAQPVTSIIWPRYSQILDQGNISSCTGNALTGALGCAPFVNSAADAGQYNENFAVKLYEEATTLDNFPGSYPPDDTGSSGLAVAKAAKRDGYITSYKHATSLNGLLHALQKGPVIVGATWYSGFDSPDATGRVEITGYVRGGHEFVVRGCDAVNKLLIADNSWGTNYGLGGSFNFTFDTWNRLRNNGADCTIPLRN